jgi:hypothetical protein
VQEEEIKMENLKSFEGKVHKSFKKGEVVSLRKILLNEGEISAIESGTILYGSLLNDVSVGSPARLSDGSQTSTIRKIYEKDGKVFLETQTSIYEISPNEISDLNIENELGSVHLPADAKLAEFNHEPLDQQFRTPNGKIYEFYINQEALKDVLIEVNGGQLFRGSTDMQGRFFVVCKVKNIHLPFYVSSAGTDGKKEGTWYPFFGVTPTWVVKGEVGQNGEIEHSDEITEVQNLLNQNLKFPAGFISPRGMFGYGKGDGSEPTNIGVDLNKYIKYQNGYLDHKESKEYTKRITGYDPKNVINDGKGSAHKWVDDVVKSIK